MRALVGFLVLLGVAGCTSSTGGDGQSCTLIGCASGLQIHFTRATWPAGTYAVSVRMDGTQHALCAATLPFPTTTSGGTCNAPDVTLGTSGQMLPAAQQTITGVYIGGKPTSVHIEVSRDGVVELAQDLTPTYTTTQPNGAGCEPTCTQASATWTIP